MDWYELLGAGSIGSAATLAGTWIKNKTQRRKNDQGYELSAMDKLQLQHDKALKETAGKLNIALDKKLVLEEQNSLLREENATLKAENAALSDRVDELDAHVTRLEGKVKALTDLMSDALARSLSNT